MMTTSDKDGFIPVAPGVLSGASRETATVQPKVAHHLVSCPVVSLATRDGGRYNHASEPANWVKVWVPRGATITPRIINVWMLPSRYIGSGRGEFGYPVEFSTEAGVQLFSGWTLAGLGVVDGYPDHWWNYGPYAWIYLGLAGMSGYVLGGWPHGVWYNNTGVSQYVVVQSSASNTYAGQDTIYTLELTITGGDWTTGIPPLRQRARSDGLTTDTRQQKNTNSSSQKTDLWWVGRKA